MKWTDQELVDDGIAVIREMHRLRVYPEGLEPREIVEPGSHVSDVRYSDIITRATARLFAPDTEPYDWDRES